MQQGIRSSDIIDNRMDNLIWAHCTRMGGILVTEGSINEAERVDILSSELPMKHTEEWKHCLLDRKVCGLNTAQTHLAQSDTIHFETS